MTMKKNRLPIFGAMAALFLFASCGLFGGAAKKNWTSSEVLEFHTDCEANAKKMLGPDGAKVYCDCAIDKVAKAYDSYAEVKKASFKELRAVAKGCE